MLSFSLLHQKPKSLTLIRTKTKTVSQLFMANIENFSTVISVEDDAKFGFTQSKMYKTNLTGTIDLHDHYIFSIIRAQTRGPSNTDLLPKLLSSAIKARKNDITLKLTICGRVEGADGDVSFFPKMIKYKPESKGLGEYLGFGFGSWGCCGDLGESFEGGGFLKKSRVVNYDFEFTMI